MFKTRLPVILACLVFTASTLIAAEDPLGLNPVRYSKETNNLIEVVKVFVKPRAVDGQATLWVYFTDKDIYNEEQFADAASKVTLTERAIRRRAKMGRDRITFADLPVHSGYVAIIQELGADLRRQSRWLNAASFEVPLELIDKINNLPFVARVRPVSSYYNERTTESPELKFPAPKTLNNYTLNYGISLNQLEQINATDAHELGINGSGVLVGMFDTGFRTDHVAFAEAVAGGRLVAEYDFVFDDSVVMNEGEDLSTQHNHGTYTWSALGGAYDGKLYGPAYGASFVLAKTEDLRSETPVEEDNWLAAVEWADSIGVQVISSSLVYGYNDWYNYSDFDGQTAVVTQAANLAVALGIVVCNSMGNSGPDPGTFGAPADAPEILSVGAVGWTGDIAEFSSRGPTIDGRIKPEVCAQGVSTYCASGAGISLFAYLNGTSLSAPLVGGAAAMLLSVRPGLTPQMVRQALMQTASRANTPDNDYGWGIINVMNALNWGAHFYSDIRSGHVPLDVSFYDSSYIPADNWSWSFGDGDSSTQQNPIHTYDTPGIYNVAMSTTADGWEISADRQQYILALADTIIYRSDTVLAGEQAVVDVYLANSQPLSNLLIPLDFSSGSSMTLDTFSVQGGRAEDFSAVRIAVGENDDKMIIRLFPDGSPLPPGSGTVLRFFLRTDPDISGSQEASIDTTSLDGIGLNLTTEGLAFVPAVTSGMVLIYDAIRGDVNGDDDINVGDPVFLINFIFRGGPAPEPSLAADVNIDGSINLGDAVYLINYIFKNGPPPPTMR